MAQRTIALGLCALAFLAGLGFVAAPASAEPLPADAYAACTLSLPPRCEGEARVLDEHVHVSYP